MPEQTVTPELSISSDDAFAILLKAREYAVKVPQTDPDSGSNATDDMSIDALELGPQDDTRRELLSAIHDLNDGEQNDLIALIYVGRGDFTLDQWDEAKQEAANIDRKLAGTYVAEIPLASDYLEEGLSQFDESLQDYMDRH